MLSFYEGVARHGAPRAQRQFLKSAGSNLALKDGTLCLSYRLPYRHVAEISPSKNWGSLADHIRTYFQAEATGKQENTPD